jgi:GAF domain-containing protein
MKMEWYWILIILSAIVGPFEAMHAVNRARRNREEAEKKRQEGKNMINQPETGMLSAQAEELIREEPWYVAVLSNLSALIMQAMPGLNWAGFYLIRGDMLTVGPFQGKPACIRIPVGKGVCGTAIERNETIVVPDVHAFPGHIACDSASASEIVIPIHAGGRIIGVLDIDSPELNRFTEQDRRTLEALVRVIEEKTAWDL